MFVSGIVRKYELKESLLHIIEVSAEIALELKENLPAGNIRKEMSMEQILEIIAKSFGMPVTCHEESPPVKFYNGKWDGKKNRI